MDDLCPHDWDPKSCPPCQRAAGRLDPLTDEEAEEFFFTAKYEGHCPGCDLPIYVGQRIAKLHDAYRHAMCVRT